MEMEVNCNKFLSNFNAFSVYCIYSTTHMHAWTHHTKSYNDILAETSEWLHPNRSETMIGSLTIIDMRRSTIAIRITHHQLNCTPYWPYPTHSHYPDYLHSSLFPPSVVFCGKVSSGIKQHAGRREASKRASKQAARCHHARTSDECGPCVNPCRPWCHFRRHHCDRLSRLNQHALGGAGLGK